MTATISELSDLATQLNNTSGKVNKHIRETSEALDQLEIGLEEWLDSDFLQRGDYRETEWDEDSNAPINGYTIRWCEVVQLGFCRVESKWQLATREAILQEYFDNQGTECERIVDPQDAIPLLKASREVRIAALKLLDLLTDALVERMKAQIDTVSGINGGKSGTGGSKKDGKGKTAQ